jgi:opacity protein-like surface antigen
MKLTSRVIIRRMLVLESLAIAITIGAASQAQAQVNILVSPMVGSDAGGNAGCPSVNGPRLNDCQDKTINAGVSVGAVGSLYGVEEEMAYAPNIFGDAPGFSSSVFTLMINGLFIPRAGPLRPYAFAGMGLIRTHVELTTTGTFATPDSNFGWDAGGGLIGFVSERLGARGDLRYFRSAQDTAVAGFTLRNSQLDFWRASAGIVLKF